MRVVAIIQARMGSSRLPGKVLKDIEGKTMLGRVVERVQQARKIDEVVVATTVQEVDEAIVAECQRLNVASIRGSEGDVLDRYYQAAQSYGADAVARTTSDCPLIDPGVIDLVISAFEEKKPDYASNTLERTYPRGLDTEVLKKEALTRAWQEARKPFERIHVTPYIYQNPALFQLLSVVSEEGNFGDLRWTVDTEEDLRFVRNIYQRVIDKNHFNWQDILKILNQDPSLIEINKHIRQKTLEEG